MMKWVWAKDLIRLFIDEIIVKIKVYRYWEVLLYVITQIEMDFGVSGCLHEANVSSETKRTIAQRNWCLKTYCMCICVCIPHLPANAQTFNWIQRASNAMVHAIPTETRYFRAVGDCFFFLSLSCNAKKS